MIDENKIENAATKICDYGSIFDSGFRIDGFKKGANWVMQEILKDLQHLKDKKTIESSARGYSEYFYGTLKEHPTIVKAFKEGANWAIREMSENLQHKDK